MSNEYFKRPLGPFYRDFSHRLVVYLLVWAAYVVVPYLTTIMFYGPDWLMSDLAHIAAGAFKTALIFAGSLILVDIGCSRLVREEMGYRTRTVGRQWLVMFIGFLMAYVINQTVFPHTIELYGPWLSGYGPSSPKGFSRHAAEFISFLVLWLPIAYLTIGFALRNQRTALKPIKDSAADGPAHHDSSQADPKVTQSVLTLENRSQNLEIPFDEITHVTVEDHYCRLFHKNGEQMVSHLVRVPLKRLEGKLPPERFVRIHRSHIVNLQHVLGWRMVQQQRHLVLDHDIGDLPISRSRFREIENIIKALKRQGSSRRQTQALKEHSSG